MAGRTRAIHPEKIQSLRSLVTAAEVSKGLPLAACVVKWYDHRSIDHGWMSPDAVEKEAPRVEHVYSVGFPVFVNKDVLVLAQNVGDDGSMSDLIQILRKEISEVSPIYARTVETKRAGGHRRVRRPKQRKVND